MVNIFYVFPIKRNTLKVSILSSPSLRMDFLKIIKWEDRGTNETAAFEKKLIADHLRLHRCSSSLKLKFKVHISRANSN